MTLLWQADPVVHERLLAPAASSAAEARKTVRAVLGKAMVDAWPADLLASEIVTNAVRHARTRLRLAVAVRDGVVRVEVADGSTAAPVLVHSDELSTSGRGMWLVQGLSTRWGWHPRGAGGKVVWFELPAIELL